MDRIFSLRKAVKGQAIIEYVVFITMFSLAIIVFSNRGFFQRVIQGRTRSAIAQSVGVEQFDGDPSRVNYDAARVVVESDMSDLDADLIIISPRNNYPNTADLISLE